MSSDLMTSTIKSEPAGPLPRLGSCGVPTSAAATLAEGGSADGSRAGSIGLGAGAAKDVVWGAPCAGPAGRAPAPAGPLGGAPRRTRQELTPADAWIALSLSH